VAHEDRASLSFEVGLGETQRLVDPQASSPQDRDQRAHPDPVGTVPRDSHHRDDLLDPGRIGRVPQALVPWSTTHPEAWERRRRARATGRVQERNG
jgi:hypothetical protein